MKHDEYYYHFVRILDKCPTGDEENTLCTAHPSGATEFSGVRVVQSLVFCVMFS